MNDIFEHIIKSYLDSKEYGWSPFEMHIIDEEMVTGAKIDNKTFKSYRCLLKQSFENGKDRYYDLIPDSNNNNRGYESTLDGIAQAVLPGTMNLQNVYSNYSGITSFGSWRNVCYIVIIDRNSKEVVACSGTLFPMTDRRLYMLQFSNMFKRFDAMVIESNVEHVIKKRFE